MFTLRKVVSDIVEDGDTVALEGRWRGSPTGSRAPPDLIHDQILDFLGATGHGR